MFKVWCEECFYAALTDQIYTDKYIIYIRILILQHWQISEVFAAPLHCANVRSRKQTGPWLFAWETPHIFPRRVNLN